MKRVGSVPVSALQGGVMVRLAYPPYDVLVTMVDGEPVAIEDGCNHAGASLSEGDRDDACVRCPMHGYLFDLRSGKLVAPEGLCDDQRTFRAVVEGDDVVVYDPLAVVIVGL